MAGRSFATRTEWCVLPLTHPTLRVGSPLSRGAGGGLFPVDGESLSPAPREREGPAPQAWEGESISLLAAILGYLLGSIPFGLLLTRLAGHGDIRQIGSGSIGATNVLRTGSTGAAALTLVFDLAKGWAAVVIARGWGEEAALVAAG